MQKADVERILRGGVANSPLCLRHDTQSFARETRKNSQAIICHSELVSESINSQAEGRLCHRGSEAIRNHNRSRNKCAMTMDVQESGSKNKDVINDTSLASLPLKHFASKCAFTLAEVLITLGIIGVVAALTLPTLIHKQQDKEVASKLKKVNSILNQSFQLAVEKYGEVDSWGFQKTEGLSIDPDDEEAVEAAKKLRYDMSSFVLSRLSENLKVLSRCYLKDGCTEKYTRYNLVGKEYSTFTPQVVLSDGTIIYSSTVVSADCTKTMGTSKVLQNVCGELFVDINGKKGPNKQGQDVFLFYYTKYGIVPMGTTSDTYFKFDSDCSSSVAHVTNGYGCTAWVIENENRDYLHCNDLSWDGKRKCK